MKIGRSARGGALLALAVAVTAGCTAYPVSLTPGPRPDPEIVDFSRSVVWPFEVALTRPSYLALFSIGDDLAMEYPLVPVSRLERIYGTRVDIENDRVVEFRSRHPWPHPDSVPDPFVAPARRFDAGTHELQLPYARYVVQDLTYPQPCTYYLLIASDTPLGLGGIFDLEWERLPRSPREISEAVIDAVGLDSEGAGWSAQLEQGRCERNR